MIVIYVNIVREEMSRIKQNIILLQEKSFDPYDISLNALNMYLNRLCINEDAGFELSGVFRLREAYKKSRIPMNEYQSRIPINEYQKNIKSFNKIHGTIFPSDEPSDEPYRAINNEIESCFAQYVSRDNHFDQKNVSHETEISTHLTQNDFGQSDISREKVLSYGLAKQERREKGNGF